MRNAELQATDERLAQLRPALAPHVGHTVKINGYVSSVRPLEGRTDADLARRYLGFAVWCTCCRTDISRHWN
jgi:hypothetical protein